MNTDWAAVIDAWAVRFLHEMDYSREADNARLFKWVGAGAGGRVCVCVWVGWGQGQGPRGEAGVCVCGGEGGVTLAPGALQARLQFNGRTGGVTRSPEVDDAPAGVRCSPPAGYGHGPEAFRSHPPPTTRLPVCVILPACPPSPHPNPNPPPHPRRSQMAAAGVDGIVVADVRRDLSSDLLLVADWVPGRGATGQGCGTRAAGPPGHRHRRWTQWGQGRPLACVPPPCIAPLPPLSLNEATARRLAQICRCEHKQLLRPRPPAPCPPGLPPPPQARS